MSERYKADDDWPYFVTFTVVGWVDLFTRDCYCEIIYEAFSHCIKTKDLLLQEYVIMPSHIHFIAQHHESKLWAVIRDFKSNTAKKIYKTVIENHEESRREWIKRLFHYYAKYTKQNVSYMVWRKSNRPIVLDKAFIYDQKRDYLWNNPVEAGYVDKVYHWNHSSAKDSCRLSDMLYR